MKNPKWYYRKTLNSFYKNILPKDAKKVVVTSNLQQIKGKYEYIILENTFASTPDIQNYIKSLKANSTEDTRIVAIYYNFLWKPILSLATLLYLRSKDETEPNWLSTPDISNLFHLEGFQEIKRGKFFLMPIPIGYISKFINTYLAKLPLLNNFCLITYQIYRLIPENRKYSVSIVIPTRNEAGNIKNMLSKIPTLGSKTEVIFVEGGSTDNTRQAIAEEIEKNKKSKRKMEVSFYTQKGKGKGDAVRLGFSKSKNEILMILDADLTVPPSDLIKFYSAISEGKGEFINGTRLVYPMEKQAMRTLNYLGNTFFSMAFTYILDQRLKDTLCGTKVLLRKHYKKIEQNRSKFGNFDPFGDYDLLFGANNLHLKITEIPIKYRERVYGTTNISRFKHGWLLVKMVLFAAKKIKFT